MNRNSHHIQIGINILRCIIHIIPKTENIGFMDSVIFILHTRDKGPGFLYFEAIKISWIQTVILNSAGFILILDSFN